MNRAVDSSSADDIDYVLAVEVALPAEELLLALVVIVRVVLEVPRYAPVGPVRVPLGAQHHVLGVADGPAGEGAGALLDVLFRIAAHAHREELQQLAAEVLVDRLAMVVVVVEPHDHRRVPRQLDQESPEVAEPVPAEHLDLVRQHLAVNDLRVARGEDAVPEERRLLSEGRPGGDHPVQPVVAAAPGPHHARLLVVEPTGHVVAHPACVRRIDQLLDRRVVPLRGVRLYLFTGRAESRPAHQVGYQPSVLAHDALRCQSIPRF